MFNKEKNKKDSEALSVDESGGLDFKFILGLLVLALPFFAIFMKRYVKPKTKKDDEHITLSKSEDRLKEEDDSMVVIKPEKRQVIEKVEKKEELNTSDLSPRQQEIYDFIKSNKKVDTNILNAKFKDVTVRTIRRDLNTLVEKGLVQKNGETKGVTYTVA